MPSANRAVVFIDVSSPDAKEQLKRAVESNYSQTKYVDVTAGGPHRFIDGWLEQYGSDQGPTVSQQSELDDLKSCFTCFVTETQTAADADVSYAVFVAGIPTLTLTVSPSSHSFSPLLHTLAVDTEVERTECMEAFFAVSPRKPEVIVIEGGDGAGKQTQTELLVRRFKADGKEVHTLDFPHEQGLYGGLIRVILSGKKGSISELNPQLFSLLYSLNRFGCARLLHFWLRRGCTVVLDRYYTANFGHQASKLPREEREGFIRELEFSEVEWLGVPKATAVLYLDLPPAAALEAMRHDATRRQLDIHETAGGNYKEMVRQTYMWCCRQLPSWHCVQCFGDAGQRLTREEVHAKVVDKLEEPLNKARTGTVCSNVWSPSETSDGGDLGGKPSMERASPTCR